MNFRFQNRAEAGRLLADKLESYAGQRGVVVLGLPRGGVPVAFEVSQKLHCPLHAFIVRKLGVPGQEELAMGAIASGGVCFLNQQVIRGFRIPQRNIDQVVARERKELERREELYSIGPPPELGHRMVILVDDGLATGASMRAAVKAVQQQNPLRVVVAAPVAAWKLIWNSSGKWMTSFACKPRNSWKALASGTSIPRRATRKCEHCWNKSSLDGD